MSGGVVALIVILCVVSVAGLVAGLAFLERSGCEDARAAGALSLRTNSAHAMRCAAPKRRGQRAHASTHLSVFSGRPSVVKIKKKMIKVVHETCLTLLRLSPSKSVFFSFKMFASTAAWRSVTEQILRP